ncbi:cg30 [Cyclophragma undans nucleopolyhedrovirus]|uniref:Cg30 n=1 Tax=Cyclophragma undans nucleopolyhedrovirus TaxID=1906244 RepID=A0A288Q7J0_9ABAC|nr:cg30 [Cyclophragma undans nucleopolyhedrovirus]AOT85538.1 cg30 [Cyclophragma undans nucleopolyhedrovirus]
MEFVKLQCNVCWSVAEIKSYFFNCVDRINIIPIVELHSCKHHLCSTCVRIIRKKKKVLCPLCREENAQFNLYSVNRNVVDVIKCSVASVQQWNMVDTMYINAASVASTVFEKSLVDEDDDYGGGGDGGGDGGGSNASDAVTKIAETALDRIKRDVCEQTKLNIKQKMIFEKSKEIGDNLQNKISKMKSEYDDLHRKVKSLQLKRITSQKALDALNREHVKISNKNSLLTKQNKCLSSKNIDLIKHKNILYKEYMTLAQKYNVVTNMAINMGNI